MTKFEEEFNYLIELSGKVLIGQVDAEAFEKNRIAFFEKYETGQQQALPVVPSFVAEWYEEEKDRLEFAVYDINTSIYRKSLNDRTTIENWFARADNKPIETVFKMKDGYTVEKPQLFYLKHIDMSKADKECDWYLITDCVKLCHEWVGKNLKPKDDDFKFTQEEIDSMQTGSYEKIEVEE
ncbi:hypothetical protein P7266_0347 [Lactococcus cremoris]|nr:hypothetical protein P7266_0347 [Lactococcus cremoris]